MDEVCGNCFIIRNKYRTIDYMKFTVWAPFVLLRIIAISLCVALCWILSNIAYYIWCIHNPSNYQQWKHTYIAVPMFFLKMAMFCAGFYRTEIREPTVNTDRPAPVIIITPHTSLYDIYSVCALGFPSFVARQQLQNAWFIGKLARLLEPILVDREEASSRQTTARAIQEKAANNERILLFPEGTCTNREMLLKFRNGAFLPGLPVQPVFLQFKQYTTYDHISWTWDGPGEIKILLLTLYQFRTDIKLTKLPIYVPREEEVKQPTLFARNVQKYISRQMNIRAGFYSYDDVQFLQLAKDCGIPRSPMMMKLLKVCKKMAPIVAASTQVLTQETGEGVRSSPARPVPTGKIEIRKKAIGFEGGSVGSRASLEALDVADEKALVRCALERVINIVLYKMETSESKVVINTKDHIISLLDINTEPMKRSSYLEDFRTTLLGTERENSGITLRETAMVFLLADGKTLSLWERISNCIAALNGVNRDSHGNFQMTNDMKISVSQYKLMVWFLLGIEESLVPEEIFNDITINYSYISKRMPSMFKRAVQENADDLFLDF